MVAILFALALYLDAEAVDALGRALGAGQATSPLARLMWPALPTVPGMPVLANPPPVSHNRDTGTACRFSSNGVMRSWSCSTRPWTNLSPASVFDHQVH